MRKVLILTEQKGWHFDQLNKSFLQKQIEIETKNLIEMSLSFTKDGNKILVNNSELKGVTDVFVRHIPNGSLEEVVTYLNILKILKTKGLNVMNSAEHIELTVDKSMTTALLNQKEINTPKTWVLRGIEETRNLVKRLLKLHPLIYKPLFGSQGTHVKKIEKIEDVDDIVNNTNIYYLQEFLNTKPFHDYRILVIKGPKITKTFSMIRFGESYINNYSKGAKCMPVELDAKLIKAVSLVVEMLGLPFCGVDIIKQGDQFFVIEINGIPAWKGLQSITKENISDIIVNAFLNKPVSNQDLSIKPIY